MSFPGILVHKKNGTSKWTFLLLLVMWTLSVLLAALLITPILSNPLTNNKPPPSNITGDLEPDSELVDEFYDVMKRAFDKHFDQVTKKQSAREADSGAEAEQLYNFESSLKGTESTSAAKLQSNGALEVTFSPQYPCDRFDEINRSCTYVRQLGTTLTFAVNIANKNKNSRYRVRWFRFFKRLKSDTEIKEELFRDDLPWNINIGGENDELRISPITESDFSYNCFVATVETVSKGGGRRKRARNLQYVKFNVEPIDVDMGVLYHGEELTVYVRSFVELPSEGIQYEWTLGDTDFQISDLPSNMKIVTDGSSVIIKELRTAGDKVLICSIYTNKNVFVARRNFLIRKIGGSRRNAETRRNPKHEFKRRRKRSLFDGAEVFEGRQSPYRFPRQTRNYYAPPRTKNTRKRTPVFERQYRERSDEGVPDYDYLENEDSILPSTEPPTNPSEDLVIDKKLFYDSSAVTSEPLQFQMPPVVDQQVKLSNPAAKVAVAPQLNGLIQEANDLVQSPAKSSGPSEVFRTEPEKLTFEDRESKLIAECKKNSECSVHGKCHKSLDSPNFCRCSRGYKGNGLFCWIA